MVNNLKKLRKDRGLTQAELACFCGLNLNTIKAYETNWRDLEKASFCTVIAICTELECSISELIDLEKIIEENEVFNKKMYNAETIKKKILK